MTTRNKALKFAVGAAFSSVAIFSPMGVASAATVYVTDTDPAHHTTDVNDHDPAHHRPFVFCSASSSDCVAFAVTGFDLNGNPVGTTYTVTEDNDPAHHSTNTSDRDPAHHQPTVVNGKLVAIPGFDLAGNYIGTGSTSTTTAPPVTVPVTVPPASDTDPAHHTTNLSDPDPAHHQPIVVDGKLMALPGFDLNGYPLHEDFFA